MWNVVPVHQHPETWGTALYFQPYPLWDLQGTMEFSSLTVLTSVGETLWEREFTMNELRPLFICACGLHCFSTRFTKELCKSGNTTHKNTVCAVQFLLLEVSFWVLGLCRMLLHTILFTTLGTESAIWNIVSLLDYHSHSSTGPDLIYSLEWTEPPFDKACLKQNHCHTGWTNPRLNLHGCWWA